MIRAIWFGRRTFTDGLKLQNELHDSVVANLKDKKFVDTAVA